MAVPPVGAHIEQEIVLDAAVIRAGADLVGDHNPLHRDAAAAARSRFGGIIASGAHTSALLAGLSTRGFGGETKDGETADGRGAVGVELHSYFLAPVHVDRPLRLEWTVVSHEPRRSGTRVRLEGKIVDLSDGTLLLKAELTTLHFA